MRTRGERNRLASIAVVALVALAVVPVLASSASAAPVPSSASGSRSTSWAFGGEASWGKAGTIIGTGTLTWNVTVGVDVVYNATNTTANITELSATRTIVVDVTATYTGPVVTWSYSFKATENDLAYANVTNAAAVTLVPGGSSVAALGILNASVHGNASIQASLLGATANKSMSDYLNVSGWGKAAAAFTPALGLVPLNLTGVTGWSSNASADSSRAWNVSWAYSDHGWDGVNTSDHGDFNGTYTNVTQVYLNGSVGPVYSHWSDHALRTAVRLTLSGPFDLHAGIFLVPRQFDLFNGAAHPFDAAALGTSAAETEYVFFDAGRVSARSMTAANMTAGASTPATFVSSGSGPSPASTPQVADYSGTVWAQPESPSAAQAQANCLEYGCPGTPHSWLLTIGIVAVAAVVAVALVVGLRSRGRRGKAADTPLTGTPSMPTPPSGPTPGNGQGQPPQ